MANTATRTPALGEDEASRKYEEAVALLANSLGERKRLFDPTYLAFAQGILAPTQTGGFGEALGNAAKSVGLAQDAEEKRNQEMLQARVAMAGQGVEISRAKANEKAVQDWLRSQNVPKPEFGPLSQPVQAEAPEALSAPPQGGLLQAEAPAPPVLPTMPSGPLPSRATVALPAPLSPPRNVASAQPLVGFQGGRQIMPPNSAYMTQADYVKLNAGKGIPLGDLLAKGAEIERHGMDKTEGAMIDKRTGMAYSIKDQMVDMPIYGEGYGGKTYKISEQDAMRLGQLQREKNYAAYKELADTATGANFGQPASAKPVDNSVEGKAIAAERQKELAKAETNLEIESRKDFNQRKKDADETITTANVFRKFAADPNAKNMFGILNNDKISSGVATLVRDGVGLPGFTVGTRAIEDVMRNAGLSAGDQAKYRTFLTYAAMMQLQAQKYMKGAVSDNEQKLLANAGIGPQDTPETIRTKADVLTLRAQKDRRVAKAFKDSKMTADEFLDSDKYGEIMDKFNTDIAEIAVGSKMLVPASAKPVSKNKDLDAAKARVNAVLEGK